MSPLLGGNPIGAATRGVPHGSPLNQIGKAIGAVGSKLPQVVSATVLSDYASNGNTLVGLDTAPTTPVKGYSLTGVYAAGTRVKCLLYPPTGVLVLGPNSGTLRLAAGGDITSVSTNHPFQIGPQNSTRLAIDTNEIQAFNGAIPSTLFLNNEGGLLQINDTAGAKSQVMGLTAYSTNTNVTANSTTAAVDNTNGPNGTFLYPPSGIVAFTLTSDVSNSTTVVGNFSQMTFRVRNTSAGGAVQYTGVGLGDARLLYESTLVGRVTVSRTVVVTGLTPALTGASVGFVEGLYSIIGAASTATFRGTSIVIHPSF